MIWIKIAIKATIRHHGKTVVAAAGEINGVTHKAMGDIFICCYAFNVHWLGRMFYTAVCCFSESISASG